MWHWCWNNSHSCCASPFKRIWENCINSEVYWAWSISYQKAGKNNLVKHLNKKPENITFLRSLKSSRKQWAEVEQELFQWAMSRCLEHSHQYSLGGSVDLWICSRTQQQGHNSCFHTTPIAAHPTALPGASKGLERGAKIPNLSHPGCVKCAAAPLCWIAKGVLASSHRCAGDPVGHRPHRPQENHGPVLPCLLLLQPPALSLCWKVSPGNKRVKDLSIATLGCSGSGGLKSCGMVVLSWRKIEGWGWIFSLWTQQIVLTFPNSALLFLLTEMFLLCCSSLQELLFQEDFRLPMFTLLR